MLDYSFNYEERSRARKKMKKKDMLCFFVRCKKRENDTLKSFIRCKLCTGRKIEYRWDTNEEKRNSYSSALAHFASHHTKEHETIEAF